MAKRITIEVKQERLDEEELPYAGTYIVQKLNAYKQALALDRSMALDPITKVPMPKMGTMQFETVLEALESAPFDMTTPAKKRKMVQEMPAWLLTDLYVQLNSLSEPLSDTDRKN